VISMRMKWLISLLGILLLGPQTAFASDTTGALVIIPIGGSVIGLVMGAVIWLKLRRQGRKASVWLMLPAGVAAGIVLSALALAVALWSNMDKVVASFGPPAREGGGGINSIQVPPSFSTKQLEAFYRLINNRENSVLRGHEFTVALVRQSNGIHQVQLGVYPRIGSPSERSVIDSEVERQMDLFLGRVPGDTTGK